MGVWGHLGAIPSPPHPLICHPPKGDPWNWSKFNNTWTNQDVLIPFEDLKSVETPPPMGGCMSGWMGQWANGSVRSNH